MKPLPKRFQGRQRPGHGRATFLLDDPKAFQDALQVLVNWFGDGSVYEFAKVTGVLCRQATRDLLAGAKTPTISTVLKVEALIGELPEEIRRGLE